jgi:GNAT superfamily N-acetyltransferase
MTEAARPATLDDLDRLAELAAVAVAEQAGDRGGPVWSVREARELPADETLRRDLLADDTLVLAGTIDGVVVGYAVATRERLRDGRQLGRITDLYVEPMARAVGVGECLADAIVAWCAEQGCSGIDALALPGNRDTKNFFETFGFTARAIVVHRSLS